MPTAAARRDAWVNEQVATTGIDETLIRDLVESFYGRIRIDPALGPIFGRVIADWPTHLDRMVDFWSGVALMTGRYKGKPLQAHLPLAIRPTHFARWLHLWRETVTQLCTAEAAAFFIGRAERIAESLQLGIAHAQALGLSPPAEPPSFARQAAPPSPSSG